MEESNHPRASELDLVVVVFTVRVESQMSLEQMMDTTYQSHRMDVLYSTLMSYGNPFWL
jgi:hypothetical protein